MFSSDDTIVALATPEGRAGIGVVRVSGADAMAIVARIVSRRRGFKPRYATRTTVPLYGRDATGDQVLVTWFPAPHSYTGEDVIEIGAHGSPVILRAIIRRAIEAGARLARPGEFTLRAFLRGKLDLVQAEAVADLVNAATPVQAQLACDQLEGTLSEQIARVDCGLLDLVARLEASLDFPDEGFHFIAPEAVVERIEDLLAEIEALAAEAARVRMIREGATVVIVGRTNVGKSSLFNALVGQDRAIVTDVAGTTRDLITEQVEMEGLAVTLVDTAGRRSSEDAIEREGVARAVRAQGAADLTLLLLDAGEALREEDRQLLEETATARRVVVASKCDRPAQWQVAGAAPVSTKTGVGVDELRGEIVKAIAGREPLKDRAAISNLRHAALLGEAGVALGRARAAIVEQAAPEEFVLIELHEARRILSEIVGTGASDEVLEHIFKHFCIGK